MRLIRFNATGVYGFLRLNIRLNNQLTFLTGINGSGKTTALNAIVALVTPDLSALSRIQYQKLEVTLENDELKSSIISENIDDSISLRTNHHNEPLIFQKYIYDPDVPIHRQLDEEAEHYRELRAAHISHPVLKLIASLPTPMFLGLDRRSKFENDLRPRRYRQERTQRASRNIFSASLAQSLMDASSLAEDQYRDALISSGRIAEELQQEMLLNLLTVDPKGEQFRLGALTVPTDDDAKEIETVRRDLETLPQILRLPQKEIRNRVTPFLDILTEYMKNIPQDFDIDEIFRDQSIDSNILNSVLGWNANQIHLKIIKTISAAVSSYNQRRAEIFAPTTNYLNLVNRFLNDSGKTVSFGDRGGISVSLKGVDDEKPVGSLSSGEAQIFVILTQLAFNPLAQQDNVFIIDEPELSLHIQWQELFVDSIITANPNIQYVLATHSPSIILDRIQDCVDLAPVGSQQLKTR